DYGPWHGFLAFWVYWMGIALLFPSIAMFYMSMTAYLLGPAYVHLADNRTYMVITSLAAIWIALGTNLVGMKIGKWTENIGGAAMWILGLVLAGAAALVWMKRGPATELGIVPSWNWGTVNFWATIAYGVSGIEMAGFLDSEIRDPERAFPKAARIASLFATAFYIVVTLALVVVLRPEDIGEMTGMPQAGAVAAGLLHAPWLPAAIAALVLANALGGFGGMAASVSRLPLAAGADRLLPKAFAKVHPRWGTPHISLLTFGAAASLLLVAIQFGDTVRAAYQTLISLMILVGFLPYVYIFGGAWKAGKRISAASGMAVTVLACVCSVAPTAEVSNVWLFEAKIAAGTAAVIGSAWLVYRRSIEA
ncbi:MAG TPA: APC family permease, partial [Bryobacteraceae bacterium]|nr:APC family permease [Bryobacteraceae bacterium]